MSSNLRAVAVTLSPRWSAASAQMRPKPREAPVINHVFFILIPLKLLTGFGLCAVSLRTFFRPADNAYFQDR